MKPPILITGAARSGTSMVAGIVHRCGAKGGAVLGPTPYNRRGQYENRRVTDTVVKPYLLMQGLDPLGAKQFAQKGQAALFALEAMDIPIIACVNGFALGGGCEIAMACDFLCASEDAKLGQPEIILGGLAPAAAPLLPRIMGEKKAFEMLLLGESMSAVDAERFGLVNKVVPLEELDAAAEEIARKFLKMSGLSVKLVRDAFYKCAEISDLDEALETAVELGIKSWETEDGQEGLKSYMEKREPVWKNK